MSGLKSKKTKKKTSSVKSSSTTTGNPKENVSKETLTLIDATCPVCLSIMIHPVSMPCTHALCMYCFELNVSQANLACPLCRKRISVWVRKMSKTKQFVDEKLWKRIQENFREEVEARLKGNDDLNNTFMSTLPPRRVSAPGEIKEEFETQLKKLREEEEEKRKEEEQASKHVISKLQEEELKCIEQLHNERETLSTGDFEFAKQLRSSQIKETLNNIKNKKGKSPQPRTSHSKLAISSPVGPMDLYLDQVTPSTSSENFVSPLSHSTPRVPSEVLKFGCSFSRMSTNDGSDTEKKNNAESRFKIKRKNIEKRKGPSVEASAAFASSDPSSPPLSSSPSRLLKDITPHYSSESESEFDSEENVIKSEKNVIRSEKEDYNKNYQEVGEAENVFRSKTDSKEINNDLNFQTENSKGEFDHTSFLSKVFDENEEVEEDMWNKLLEEQRTLEERLNQEKEDRQFALQLQKDMRKMNGNIITFVLMLVLVSDQILAMNISTEWIDWCPSNSTAQTESCWEREQILKDTCPATNPCLANMYGIFECRFLELQDRMTSLENTFQTVPEIDSELITMENSMIQEEIIGIELNITLQTALNNISIIAVQRENITCLIEDLLSRISAVENCFAHVTTESFATDLIK